MKDLTSRELECVNGGNYCSVINTLGDIISIGGAVLIVAGAIGVIRNKKIVLDDAANNDVKIAATIDSVTGAMLMSAGLLACFAASIGGCETSNESYAFED